MTTNVISIAVDGTIEAAVDLMLSNGISGLPVVDKAGAVVGVISEGDLLHRHETGSERRRSWWLRAFASRESQAHDFIAAHSHKVADMMSKNVLTVAPDTDLREIASILEERRIKRLPVVDGGKLVGIVSRANMLQALASRPSSDGSAPTMDDRSLREAVSAALTGKDWGRDPAALNLIVNNGVVEIWGWVESEDERKALCLAAGEVPGVNEVVDHLGKYSPSPLGYL
jgi:CBS domain-containing protein